MLDADQVAPLSSAQETLLRKQEITPDSPGSILRDVDTMVDLVGDDGVRVSEPTVLEAEGAPPEQYPGW